jgi:signal transduction histidine kinase
VSRIVHAQYCILAPLSESPFFGCTVQIYTSPSVVIRVLTNLLGNALKYTSVGSVSMSLTTGMPLGDFRQVPLPKRISLQSANPIAYEDTVLMCASVTDTGPGIPNADLPRLFDFGCGMDVHVWFASCSPCLSNEPLGALEFVAAPQVSRPECDSVN